MTKRRPRPLPIDRYQPEIMLSVVLVGISAAAVVGCVIWLVKQMPHFSG